MAVHPNGDIIIADYDNKWVSIFSSEGKFKVGRLGQKILMVAKVCLYLLLRLDVNCVILCCFI